MATQFLNLPQGTLAYDDTHTHGPASTTAIICIPGMGDLRGQYRFLAPELLKAGHRVITLDLRGHGESSTKWPTYSAQTVAQDVLALLDHLNLHQATLVGNSFAARAALYAAAQRPEQIKKVVMLGPVARNPSLPWFMQALMKVAFAGPWNTAFWMMYWNSLFTSRKPADHATYTARLKSNMGQKAQLEALKTFMQPDPTDTETLMKALKTPALVVMGTRDPDFKDASAEARWVSDTMGADLMLVEGAGHYPHTEFPEQVAGKMLEFLKGNP